MKPHATSKIQISRSDVTPVVAPYTTIQRSVFNVRRSTFATPLAASLAAPLAASTSPPLSTPHSSLSTRGSAAHAFTLLEVILAVTIAGALLASAAALMVAVTNVWMDRQDRHFFEDHVDGVTEFLQANFTQAGTEIALGDSQADSSNQANTPEASTPQPEINEETINISTPGQTRGNTLAKNGASQAAGLIRVSEDPIGWSRPPGYADYQDPLIHFGLKDTPPLLIQTDDAPVLGIEAFLHFEANEGLSLLWYTPLQEDSEDINDLRRTPLSDLVTKVEYTYWDERFERWETETEPREGEGDESFILPRFLKLTFEYEGETKLRTLTIPVPSRSALIF